MKNSILVVATFVVATIVTAANAAQAGKNDSFYDELVADFRAGCGASLSNTSFIQYFQSKGVNVRDTRNLSLQTAEAKEYSHVAVLDSGILALFRGPPLPRKCCLTAFNIDANKVVGRLKKALGTRETKSIQIEGRAVTLFAPQYSNRIVLVDTQFERTRTMTNICHSETDDAAKHYANPY